MWKYKLDKSFGVVFLNCCLNKNLFALLYIVKQQGDNFGFLRQYLKSQFMILMKKNIYK